MKIPRFIVSSIGCLAIFLSACNNDIFIDDFLKHVPSATLNEGDSLVVQFDGKDWDIQGVYHDTGDFTGQIMYENGQKEYGFLEGKGLLRMAYDSDYLHFRIERLQEDRLKIILDENFGKVLPVRILVGNENETKTLELTLNQSTTYQVEKIEYDWNSYVESKEEMHVRNEITYANHSTKPMEVVVYPYGNGSNNKSVVARFKDHSDQIIRLLGDQVPKLEIYEWNGGNPFSCGVTFPIDSHPYTIDIPGLSDVQKRIRIPAQKKVIVYACIYTVTSRVPFTVYAGKKEPAANKQFAGMLEITSPVNHQILISKPVDVESQEN